MTTALALGFAIAAVAALVAAVWGYLAERRIVARLKVERGVYYRRAATAEEQVRRIESGRAGW